MGFFKAIRNQFIEVIEWTDDSRDTVVYRFPVANKEIKMNAQLTVRESQAAVFVNEGTIADVFLPGRYELTTQNMPVLTKLKSWKYFFNSPFKAEVYFVNTRIFTDQKWGTQNPITLRDPEFGMIQLRAYGVFAYRVVDPGVFMKEVFGTNSLFTAADISEYLRRLLISSFSDALAESKIAALDLVAHFDEFGALVREKTNIKFVGLGLSMTDMVIENINWPEEIDEAIKKRASMGILGDVGQYTRFQAADALRDAAKNEGSGGAFAGMGVGFGAGSVLGQTFGQAAASQQQPAAQADKAACLSCGSIIDKNAKFCPECGSSTAPKVCPKCKKIVGAAKFCPECGEKV